MRTIVRRTIFTKRACVRLTLLLVAGAIVNVAVAWGIVLSLSPWRSFGEPCEVSRADEAWLAAFESDADQCRIEAKQLSLFGVCEVIFFVEPIGEDVERRYGVNDYGWPTLSLQSGCGSIQEREDFFREEELKRQAGDHDFVHYYPPFNELWFKGMRFQGLPTKPTLPGFAINTVFYAFFLWPFFAAPFALRRRLRLKRGLCPKGAYDLRGRVGASEVCPECGARVAARP